MPLYLVMENLIFAKFNSLLNKSLSYLSVKRAQDQVTTQNNHVFMSIYAVFKLECLKLKHKANHFESKAKLFIKATRQAYAEFQSLRTA